MDVRKENQYEKEQEIELLLTENLNKTHTLVSKAPIRTEKVKIIVSGGENLENKSGGTYFYSTEKAEGAPKNKVWKHEYNDRYIFSNDSVLGWRIGKKKQLQTGTYLFKSNNLFTTSESPNIRIPILQIFAFIFIGRKYFLGQ